MEFLSDCNQVSVRNTMSDLRSTMCSIISANLLFNEQTFHNEHLRNESTSLALFCFFPSLNGFSAFPPPDTLLMKDIYDRTLDDLAQLPCYEHN